METIVLLETQLDDMNPQIIGYLFDRLLEQGAFDVFTQAIGMKKSRPGILLTVICPPAAVDTCEALLFAESTTLGLRRSFQERRILSRRWDHVTTAYGAVRVKVAWDPQQSPETPLNIQPEYEDCAQLAQSAHVSWQRVQQAAFHAWTIANSHGPNPWTEGT